MSKRISQLLLLIEVMASDELKYIYPISRRRSKAVKEISDFYNVHPSTIRDIYVRRLGLGTNKFDRFLESLFENRDKSIFELLRQDGDAKNLMDIDSLENKILKPIPHIKLAPSILSADFARLGEQVVEATKADADYIHIDVMDGHFVPNLTIGAPVVAAVRAHTNLPLDVHLMIQAPERHIKQFADAGANIITVHVEACHHIHRTVQTIKESGVRAGAALNPGTPLDTLSEILPYLDLVLVMTVNPGFGGQTFIEGMLDKIARLRAELDGKRLAAELEVDGGINAEVAPRVVQAGARVLVAGAAVFGSGQTVKEALKKIRSSLG